ncbi:MAG TPA: polyketide cyclase [Thermoanaerobaculia bacterium]|nr:polyketide cyclase [Thermoanaerobaculia bacterium]
MAVHDYHFLTHWRVRGSVAEVLAILDAPEELPRWWPAVYLDVEKRGDVIELLTKGWLPYTLRWSFHVTETREDGLGLEATGDFVGHGDWSLAQNGDVVDVTYDWRIRAEKPLLKLLSPLLKPIFEANHRWAMARGEESLALELARRRGETTPAPPPPTPTSFWKWVARVTVRKPA